MLQSESVEAEFSLKCHKKLNRRRMEAMQAIARPSKKRARDESSQKKLKRGGKKK